MTVRHLLAALLLVTGTGVALSTGAAPTGDQVNSTTLVPTSEYATLENTTTASDKELALHFDGTVADGDGVNPDAVTTVEDVFAIHNADNETTAEIYISDHPTGLTFLHDGAVFNESNAAEVDPNDDVSVSVRINTTGDTTVDGGDFTIEAHPA